MSQKTATVAVINQYKKLLILRRGDSAPWMPGRYCLPGGKLEPNESLEQGASRELREETNIDYNPKDLVPYTITYGSDYSKIIFFAPTSDPTVILNWEHTHYAWVSAEESSQYPLVNGLATTIKTLRRHDLLI